MTSAPNEIRDSTLLVLWRRKRIILGTLLVFVAIAAALSAVMPKVYAASSKLLVTQRTNGQSFDAVQAAQVTARTYSDLLRSGSVAQLVARRVGGSQQEVLNAVTIAPVPETQLVKITAESRDPDRARDLANAYISVFQSFARGFAGTTRAQVSLAAPATSPGSPVRPRPKLYVFMAALLGLGLGVGLALVRHRLDVRLRTAEEIESTFELPLLGRVPVRGRDAFSTSAFSEAFRVLRTNLAFAEGGDIRSVAVVSAEPQEGKSTVASQLAIASATAGVSVVLVDADVRRPAVERLLGEGQADGGPGMSDYLLGNTRLERCIRATSTENLRVMGPGPFVPSLANLLGTERGLALLHELRREADLVVFDAPPLNAGADASALAGNVDGVALVVDLDRAERPVLRDALRQLAAVRARVLGFVLNHDRGVTTVPYYFNPPESNGSGDRSKGAAGDQELTRPEERAARGRRLGAREQRPSPREGREPAEGVAEDEDDVAAATGAEGGERSGRPGAGRVRSTG